MLFRILSNILLFISIFILVKYLVIKVLSIIIIRELEK